MINVSRSQQDVQSIIGSYPAGSIQNLIAQRIANAPTTYYYDNDAQLRFEIEMRAEIVNAAVDLYRSAMNFAVFRKSKCNERYWNRDNDGGFSLRNDVSPSEAIADIFINGGKYATECATAMVIIYYRALTKMYPKELFDRTFSEITLMNWHSLDRNLREVGNMNKRSDNVPGDRRYFKNPDVDVRHPEWQGENTIDLGDGRYFGHGVGIYSAPEIIKMLNESRNSGSTTPAYLMDTAGNPDYKKLANILLNSTARPTAELSA